MITIFPGIRVNVSILVSVSERVGYCLRVAFKCVIDNERLELELTKL